MINRWAVSFYTLYMFYFFFIEQNFMIINNNSSFDGKFTNDIGKRSLVMLLLHLTTQFVKKYFILNLVHDQKQEL